MSLADPGSYTGGSNVGGREHLPPFTPASNLYQFGVDSHLAEILTSYFVAKSSHDLDGVMKHYSRAITTFTDAVMGWPMNGYEAVEKAYTKVMGKFGEGRSYPTSIQGYIENGNGSAVLEITNTPEIVGSELHMISSVDFRDDKIVRWVDYWDSTSFDDKIYKEKRAPNEQFPDDYLESQVGTCVSPRMAATGAQFCTLLSSHNASGAAELFDHDGVFEDRSLRVKIVGRLEIARYLERVLGKAPYGKGSSLRHMVGHDLGGAVEWIGSADTPVRDGIIALISEPNGLIRSATAVYDSRQLGRKKRAELIQLATDS